MEQEPGIETEEYDFEDIVDAQVLPSGSVVLIQVNAQEYPDAEIDRVVEILSDQFEEADVDAVFSTNGLIGNVDVVQTNNGIDGGEIR